MFTEISQFHCVFFPNICTCSRPDRIVPIAERFGMDPGAVLDNVSIFFPCHSLISLWEEHT